jgi:hypothetical protein
MRYDFKMWSHQYLNLDICMFLIWLYMFGYQCFIYIVVYHGVKNVH